MTASGFGASPREGFERAVVERARRDPRIVVLGADVTGRMHLREFSREEPERFISLGIAEQNMASVAAGLAALGFIPVMATYAAFCTTRALDQIRVSICYNRFGVLIAGYNAGLTAGPDGGTHQGLEDLAVMRALPGMRVFSTRNGPETYQLTLGLLAEGPPAGPTYIRLGKLEDIPDAELRGDGPRGPDDTRGGISILAPLRGGEGSKLMLLTTGQIYRHAWRALERLRGMELNVGLADLYCLTPERVYGPAGARAIRESIPEGTPCLVIEEHQAQGGLADMVQEALSGGDYPVNRMGVQDVFGESAPVEELWALMGLGIEQIARRARQICEHHADRRTRIEPHGLPLGGESNER